MGDQRRSFCSEISYAHPLPWTFDLFAVYGALWIEREIRYYYVQNRAPLFERLGEASYSIYLTHTHGVALLDTLAISKTMTPAVLWFSTVVLAGIVATVFYCLVERPSHQLARRFARQVKKSQLTTAVARG
jgi:peptidoglycan/LPS O-acetylase OafA/YrhL